MTEYNKNHHQYIKRTPTPKQLIHCRIVSNSKGRFNVQKINEMMNTGPGYKQKMEFRKFCKSMYPTCDLQQTVIDDKWYGFICYQSHRKKSIIQLSTKDEIVQ